MKAIGIVTATELPLPDPDQPGLSAALEKRGIEARLLAWDDPNARFDEVAIAVVRSTWNYAPRRDDFVAWAHATEKVTRLFNPAAVLEGNTDKKYLADLAKKGVPVVPTTFLEKGADAPATIDEVARLGVVVIKPRVSAGSLFTERFDLAAADNRARAIAFLTEHLAARPMMLQPYQKSIHDHGERSLVWIDGELTHEVRKGPRFMSGPIDLEGPLPISDEGRALAKEVLAPIADQLLYARVDIVKDDTGALQIMEIELTEPYLMLGLFEPARERLADAIARLARGV